MQNICLYFQVHQPYRLKRYRFFDIGEKHNYYDDSENQFQLQKIANNCYLPTNKILLDLIKQHGKDFKVSFSISGTALSQFEMYAPEVLESFKELAKTGNVEFLAETFSHSLVSLKSKTDFLQQVKEHTDKIEELFGQRPQVFRNTELIYDNEIGANVAEAGYKAMITEGARHILGWKSPNKLYFNVVNPELKLILKNYKLSDDIAFRFSNKAWDEYPLTAEKYVNWLKAVDEKDEVVNLFMDYETFGEHQKADTGIFDFLKAFPTELINNSDIKFVTPTELADNLQPVAPMNVEHTISWADEERDITAWLGNEMQQEAVDKLYVLSAKMQYIKDTDLQRDWKRLQASDHFYYMSTKILADGAVHEYFNPYNSAYDAFINYMNVLTDFTLRVEKEYKMLVPESKEEIKAQIAEYEEKLELLRKKLAEPEAIEKTKPVAKAISKIKKKATAISKTKKATKPISKTKPKTKALKAPAKRTRKKK